MITVTLELTREQWEAVRDALAAEANASRHVELIGAMNVLNPALDRAFRADLARRVAEAQGGENALTEGGE